MKNCIHCRTAKPLSDFLRRSGSKSGVPRRRGTCRACRQLGAEPGYEAALADPAVGAPERATAGRWGAGDERESALVRAGSAREGGSWAGETREGAGDDSAASEGTDEAPKRKRRKRRKKAKAALAQGDWAGSKHEDGRIKNEDEDDEIRNENIDEDEVWAGTGNAEAYESSLHVALVSSDGETPKRKRRKRRKKANAALTLVPDAAAAGETEPLEGGRADEAPEGADGGGEHEALEGSFDETPKRKRRKRRKKAKTALTLVPDASDAEEAGSKDGDEDAALLGSGEDGEADEEAAPKRKRRRRRKKAKAPAEGEAIAGEAVARARPLAARPMGPLRPPRPLPRPTSDSTSPRLYALDPSHLKPTRTGVIRMRGRSDNGRRWYQEIDLELATILVRERAAVVVNRQTIQRLYSNKEFRRLILNRDEYTCHFCGQYGDTIDHLLPRAKGGHTTPVNCVCACNFCNQSKADRDLEEFISSGLE